MAIDDELNILPLT